ncbi:MAG: 2-C-methyl-D-erythritol 4-phosphate cytidylyltransferase [Clostridiales bacterium]|nr:2-C-methyl-D-erythritol 4-phosphate cytidylyltransferase [Clostridiales bacterium]
MKFHIIKKIEKICNLISHRDRNRYTSAIILAAGKSERMNDKSLSKQLIEIDGIPVVIHSVLAFQKSEKINEIIVVAAENEIPLYQNFRKKYSLSKLKFVVSGGASRAESALRGFRKVSKECGFIAIHDAARCLITAEDIDRIVLEAYRTGAAIAAKRATDTVKKADENGFVTETIDRSLLWLAQTPQVFKKSVYEVSVSSAEKIDEKITDDAMLAELAGFHVKLVECMNENIKITNTSDLAIARDILMKRKTGGNA